MRILILGGTQFVGRHITENALARGHDITLFNRGKTNAHLFPDVEKISGDRDGDLDKLAGKNWDAVIDVNGYVPRIVRQTVEALQGSTAHYTFVSTMSVYAHLDQLGISEDSELATLDDPTVEEITGETYGGLKVLCEQAVQDVFPNQALIIRPGFVIGNYDHTYRLGYWVDRIRKGGQMLAPESPDYPFQGIDGKDLATFILDHIEQHTADTFNCMGPDYALTLGKLFETARDLSQADTEFVWVSPEFIEAQQITPAQELPLYLPGDWRNAHHVQPQRALAAGLTYRPLEDTLRDVLDWEQADQAHKANKSALAPEREKTLLDIWQQEQTR